MNGPSAMPPEPDLSEAIRRSASDPAAFKPVYEAWFSRVYHYCLRRVDSNEDAEDLTSLDFTRAPGKIGSFRGGSFPAWLFQIAHNVVVDFFQNKRPALAVEDFEQMGAVNDRQERLSVEDRLRVEHLLVSLSDEQRNLLALRMAGCLSSREIAVMGLSGVAST